MELSAMEYRNVIAFFMLVFPCVWSKGVWRKTCSGDLNIECATGYIIIIHIIQAERITEDDCKIYRSKENRTMERMIWDMCSGKKACTVPFDHKMSALQFLEVYSDCGVRHDLCGDVIITGNTSYLESQNFRNTYLYKPKEVCLCEAKFDSPRKIEVSFTDNSFNTSKARVEILWDNSTLETVDNKTTGPNSRGLMHSAVERFRISFVAGDVAGGGHFQLSYKADMPIKMVCNPGSSEKPKLLVIILIAAPAAFVGLLILITVIICIVKSRKSKPKPVANNEYDVADGPVPRLTDYRESGESYSSYCSSCDGRHSTVGIGMDRL